MPSNLEFVNGGGQVLQRLRGLFNGGFIGDALGFPFEGMNAQDIGETLGLAENFTGTSGLPEFRPHPSGRYEPGTVTDDTQLTLLELRCHLESGGPDPAKLAEGLGDLWRRFDQEELEIISPGFALSDAMSALAQGRSHERSAVMRGRAGCGALIRCAPAALWPWPEDASPDSRVARNAAVTHSDYRSTACCIAYGHILNHLVVNGPMASTEEALQLIGRVASRVEEINQETADMLRQVIEIHGLEEKELREKITAMSLNNEGEQWVTPYCLAVLAAALCSWLRYPRNPAAALVFAIGFGGVTDSIASLAGQLAGASLGNEVWPQNMLGTISCGPEDHKSIEQTLESWIQSASTSASL